MLQKVLEHRATIDLIHSKTVQRHQQICATLFAYYYQLIDIDTPSPTVISVKGEEKWIEDMKKIALQEGLLLGNGYGNWKNTTFRIANFPAITDEQIRILLDFLKINL